MLKLKEEDKAKVVNVTKESTHNFKEGEIVTVIDLIEDGNPPHYECQNSIGKIWYMIDEELEKQ